MPKLKELEQLKLSSITKSATVCRQIYHKKPEPQGSSVKYRVWCDKIKTGKSKVQASTRYFAKIFKFFL